MEARTSKDSILRRHGFDAQIVTSVLTVAVNWSVFPKFLDAKA